MLISWRASCRDLRACAPRRSSPPEASASLSATSCSRAFCPRRSSRRRIGALPDPGGRGVGGARAAQSRRSSSAECFVRLVVPINLQQPACGRRCTGYRRLCTTSTRSSPSCSARHVVLAGTGRVAGALFQSRGRFGFSLFLIQIHNWVLLASVPIVLLFRRPFAELVTAVILCRLSRDQRAWLAFPAARLPRTGRNPHTTARSRLGGAERSGTRSVEQHFSRSTAVIGRALSSRISRCHSIGGGDRGIGVPHAAGWRGLYSLTPRLRACNSRAQASFSSGTRPHWFSRWARSPRSWSWW